MKVGLTLIIPQKYDMFSFFSMKSDKPEEGKSKKKEFSKQLLIQESLLIWIYSIAMIVLAFICVLKQYYADIPWLTAMTSLPWTAYAVSQHAYYKKAQAENTEGGIRYETALQDYNHTVYYDTPMDEPPVG